MKIGDKTTLRSELGADTGAHGANVQYEPGVTFFPVLTLEPRKYYNLNKRLSQSKETAGNSGNYYALTTSYHPNLALVSSKEGDRNAGGNISIIPTWGIRRMINDRYHFEAGFGIGYNRYLSSEMNTQKDNLILNLHLRLGLNN